MKAQYFSGIGKANIREMKATAKPAVRWLAPHECHDHWLSNFYWPLIFLDTNFFRADYFEKDENEPTPDWW
jgi:hypothetical protein